MNTEVIQPFPKERSWGFDIESPQWSGLLEASGWKIIKEDGKFLICDPYDFGEELTEFDTFFAAYARWKEMMLEQDEPLMVLIADNGSIWGDVLNAPRLALDVPELLSCIVADSVDAHWEPTGARYKVVEKCETLFDMCGNADVWVELTGFDPYAKDKHGNREYRAYCKRVAYSGLKTKNGKEAF